MRLSMSLLATLFLSSSLAIGASEPPGTLDFPKEIQIPPLVPLVPPCADPAADRFIEIDISQRPPPGSTRVPRLSGWITPDGLFHWPFVMRVRNIGDQPFFGKPNRQYAAITETDIKGGGKARVVAKVQFDRIAAHSGLAMRFEFVAPADQAKRGRFHRRYALAITYEGMDGAIVNGRNGDCDLLNNKFSIEFDGSRKNWIFGK
jgi:hypothetical protein